MRPMETIWKYEFEISDLVQTMEIPDPAGYCFTAMQRDKLCAWFRVNPFSRKVQRNFRVTGTGHPIAPDWIYWGSSLHGKFVWHLFEVPPFPEER